MDEDHGNPREPLTLVERVEVMEATIEYLVRQNRTLVSYMAGIDPAFPRDLAASLGNLNGSRRTRGTTRAAKMLAGHVASTD